jgi:putative transposase
MLQYKSEWYGRTLVKIDRFYPSSKRCNSCGCVTEKLGLERRSWTCPSCGVSHDRDINAAKNILAAGHAVIVCGDGVRLRRSNTRAAAVCEAGT